MRGWWACTTRVWPWARPAPRSVPLPVARHTLGHGFRKHLVRRWGLSHTAAVTAWRTGVTCVWIAAPGAAGGAGWLSAPWWWPGGAGVTGEAVPVVAVPEPSSLAVFGLAVGVLALIRRKQ